MALAGMLIVTGYSAFNLVRFGYFGLTYFVGFNLAVRTTTMYEDIREPDIRRILIAKRDEMYLRGANPYWAPLEAESALREETGDTEIELSKRLAGISLDVISRNPIAYLREVARSFAAFWGPYGQNLPTMQSRLGRLGWYALNIAVNVVFFTVLILNIGAACLLGPPPGASFQAVLAYIAASEIVLFNALLSCALDWGEVRHRSPTEGLIVFSAVLGFFLWRRYADASFVATARGVDINSASARVVRPLKVRCGSAGVAAKLEFPGFHPEP
jgi:hypothetical protein